MSPHPLFGSSIQNLLQLLWKNGGVSWASSGQLTMAMGSALARAPLSIVEWMAYSRKLKQLEMKPPVFIVGHWRSGTTHIGNLLSKSPRFGFVSPVSTGLPHDLLILGRLLKPWLESSFPSDRLIDRVVVKADSPQEDEFGVANMIPISFLHGLYFPKHFQKNFSQGVFLDQCTSRQVDQWKKASIRFLKKVYLDQQQKQLLVRNPAYTTRIPLLRKMWPGARFIHIYRDPYRVFPSMKNYFNKLLPAYAWQEYHHLDIEQIVLATFKRMMGQLINDLAKTPSHEFIEIRYESLVEDPIQQLKMIYHHLDLSDFSQAQPQFEHYLNSIRGYTKNQYQQTQQEQELISNHWGEIIEHYKY